MNIQANKYLKWVNDNYDSIKNKLISFCNDKNYTWDEDTFSDTYLKIYEKILKQPLQDDTDKGFDGYTFMSFKINTMRNKQYARNQKRDGNVIDIGKAYETYVNANSKTEREKILNDLRKDYFCLYLMRKAETQFDQEHFYLFRLKTFENITYKQLADKTGLKGVRQKVVNVKNWLKDNVSKEEVEKAFEEEYGDFFEI